MELNQDQNTLPNTGNTVNGMQSNEDFNEAFRIAEELKAREIARAELVKLAIQDKTPLDAILAKEREQEIHKTVDVFASLNEKDKGTLASDLEAKLAKKDQKIKNLQDLLRRLEFRTAANISASNPQTALNAEIEAVAGEIKMLRDGMTADSEQDVVEIDFINKKRMGLLALLHEKSDDDIVLIAKVYETAYRACISTLQNRNLRIKLEKRDQFAASLEQDREKRIEKEVVKEKKRSKQFMKEHEPEKYIKLTAEEKSIELMMSFGMTREDAIKQLNNVKGLK